MSQLPDYVASATPNPADKRAPWLTTTAATYAGIMLWFVFWSGVPGGGGVAGGVLSQGLLLALGALIVAALICYFCFYYVPGMLGMKTGLPLYIVGTSTYGVSGGFLMPGFLMGLLQFGWLSVNGFFAGLGLACIIKGASTPAEINAVWGSSLHIGIGIVWAVIAAFVGLKGIAYVGRIASYMPIIPIVVLLVLLAMTIGGVGSFDKNKMVSEALKAQATAAEAMKGYPKDAGKTLKGEEFNKFKEVENLSKIKPAATLYGSGQLGVLSLMCAFVVGFFATAGAAGCDFGSGNKDAKAVQMGGLVGIAGATIFTGAIALIAIAGAQGLGKIPAVAMNPYDSMKAITGDGLGGVFMLLLAIAAFPSACFSSFIAANSFKTTLPKVNPFISCGLGTLVSCYLIYS